MKTHHATVQEATESDNTTWVFITCDPGERFESDLPYSKWWDDSVNCKNCLRSKPKAAPPGFPAELEAA